MAPDPSVLYDFATQQGARPGRWLRIAVCVFLLVSGVGGCEPREPALPSDETQPARNVSSSHVSSASARVVDNAPRIVAFGNSLTAGLGVSPDQSYPAQLQRHLREAGYHYDVINAGVSGDTTTGGLRRLAWILKSRPSVVILELGANDGLRGQPLSLMASNLTEIIEGLQQAGVEVVLAGMQIPPNYGLTYTTGFASVFKRLARDHSVTLIPFFLEGVAARKDLNQADGIHPTAEGYQIVAQTVFEVIEPLLKKERPLSRPK
ncbi:MAG: arylesterase [Nitrospira sp.]|nr:arylesterase [Nitrospira sp.]